MRFVYKQNYLKEEIIYLNTEGQLYQGIDSKENSLGEYTLYTMQLKARNGRLNSNQPERITLKDTGEFYDSFRIELTPEFDLLIKYNPQKDDTNLLKEYGADIIGLTDENMEKIRTIVRQIAVNYIRKTK
jgi:hypothetical protein